MAATRQRRWRLIALVLCFEVAVFVVVQLAPKASLPSWLQKFLTAFIGPGVAVMLIIAGYTSGVDGHAPDWLATLALVSGFLVNSLILYAVLIGVLSLSKKLSKRSIA